MSAGIEIKPATMPRVLDRSHNGFITNSIRDVAASCGISEYFVRKVTGKSENFIASDIYSLLDQDSFSETFVPRSLVIDYLRKKSNAINSTIIDPGFYCGDSLDLITQLKNESIQCVVTSTPYWAMRVYDDQISTHWADQSSCPFGLEQSPESFVRHSVQVLNELFPKIRRDGSIWWNIMDSYNTRTQIRGNAAEALRAMQGLDEKSWSDHSHRRYSAGHSYLKDGEQCLIPFKIAERASRIGYYVKSVICWAKSATTPEPQNSRVSRNIEFILHLTKERTPFFDKEAYKTTPSKIGGRQPLESEKLSDFWYLPTSSGRDGHGAQFPLELPGRCISISSKPGDIILDPFVGSGTSAMAAKMLKRECIGFDVSNSYLDLARARVESL